MSAPASAKDWYTPEELATHCSCSVDRIEMLTRRHHWPRVHGEHGGKIGVDLETVQRAAGSSPTSVHGSVDPQPKSTAPTNQALLIGERP